MDYTHLSLPSHLDSSHLGASLSDHVSIWQHRQLAYHPFFIVSFRMAEPVQMTHECPKSMTFVWTILSVLSTCFASSPLTYWWSHDTKASVATSCQRYQYFPGSIRCAKDWLARQLSYMLDKRCYEYHIPRSGFAQLYTHLPISAWILLTSLLIKLTFWKVCKRWFIARKASHYQYDFSVPIDDI